nr:CDP-glucose 4,6-dehydratase [uncultured Lachnoanaerobaculum sp.]
MNFEELKKFYNGKRVLLTGHTGFKGSWLSKILIMCGAKLTGYALNPPTDTNIFDILGIEKDMKSVVGDIRDLEHLKKVFDEVEPEYVIHMAAQPIVRDSYERPVYTYETNVIGTVNIMECVRLSKSVKSFLNVTTDKVYENKEQDKGYVETDFLDGYDPYSNSKSCSELVTHSYKKSFLADLPVSTARAGNVIGGGDFAKDRIIPDCVRAAVSGKPVIIRNPNSIRPFQHVLEPLFIYLDIVMRQSQDRERFEGYFNVGPDDSDCVNAQTLVESFKRAWGEGFDFKIKSDGGPHEAGFLKLNCDKLKKVYGWKPVLNVHDAIDLSVEWYKAWSKGEDMDAVTQKQILAYLAK